MKSDKKTRLRDIILIASLAVLGLVLLVVMRHSSESGSTAVVQVDGVVIARYPLSEDGIHVLNGGLNTIEIKDGKVRMMEALCPNLECVHQGWISRGHQSIVCLPNKLVVTIEGDSSVVDFTL